MSIRSRLFALPMPGLLKEALLRKLFRLTADAFGAAVPSGRGSAARILDRYGAFTREQAELMLRDGASGAEVSQRLGANALTLGTRLRALLGVRRMQEALTVARTLYRLIGVDFHGTTADIEAGGGLTRPAGIGTAGSGPAGGAGCATGASACFTVSRCFFSTRYRPAVCRLISSLDAGLLEGLTGGGKMVFTERITDGAAACKGVIQ